MKQRAYDLGFRVFAVQRVIHNGLDVSGVALSLGIDDKILSGWVRRYSTRNYESVHGVWQLKKQAADILSLCLELKDLDREKATKTPVSGFERDGHASDWVTL